MAMRNLVKKPGRHAGLNNPKLAVLSSAGQGRTCNAIGCCCTLCAKPARLLVGAFTPVKKLTVAFRAALHVLA